MPVRATVLVNTLRASGTRAPPKVGSRKYFWAISQVASSRTAGSGWHFGVCWLLVGCQGIPCSGAAPPTVRADITGAQSFAAGEVRLAYRRGLETYSTSFVSPR